MASSQGHVYIVGAGPGDPGLMTLAGLRALTVADVVYHDALASPALLRHARPDAEIRFVGKRAGKEVLPQERIEQLLVDDALAGKTVVRLKGGDPFVFGRGGEEALHCHSAGVRFTVVPGISSALAGPAYAGIPVTHRGLASAFMVVTGNEAGGGSESGVDWATAARADTLIILMGAATLSANMQHIIDEGRGAETPVALVRWGTRSDQQLVVGTVGDIAEKAARAGITSPVVTVVGPVVGLASELSWFRPGPLAGRLVVVTRARAQIGELATRLEALGATVVEAPAIEVKIRQPNLALRDAILAKPDWIIWTSASGVEATFAALRAASLDARSLAGIKLAVVGQATAAASLAGGLRPDFVPSRATSAALSAEIGCLQGLRVLLAVSALAGQDLADALRLRGANVTQVAAYDNIALALTDERRRAVVEADAITFTSASTAHNLKIALGGAQLSPQARLVSIGPRTSAAVRERFGRLDGEAAEPSLESLVGAVVGALT